MRLSYRILVLTFVFSLMGAGLALANTNETAKVLFHLGPKITKNVCLTGKISTCVNAVTQGTLVVDGTGPFYFCYVLVAWFEPGIGISGCQFGITYDGAGISGVDVFSWSLCGALEFPSDEGVPVGSIGWPKPGSGNLMTWDSSSSDPILGCQKDSVAVCGYLYMGAYSADSITITPRPIGGKLKIANCNNMEAIINDPNDRGSARFSAGATELGVNPCLPVPTNPVTWGLIKGMYKSQ